MSNERRFKIKVADYRPSCKKCAEKINGHYMLDVDVEEVRILKKEVITTPMMGEIKIFYNNYISEVNCGLCGQEFTLPPVCIEFDVGDFHSYVCESCVKTVAPELYEEWGKKSAELDREWQEAEEKRKRETAAPSCGKGE